MSGAFQYTGDDSESEEEYRGSSLSKQGELEFLTVREIEEKLISLPILHECPEDLLLELAQYIYRPLTRKYQEEVKSAFLSSSAASSSTRKKTHGELQDRLNTMFGEVHMFNKGLKVFHEDVQSQLTKHLLKTICTDMVNTVVNYLTIEHRVYAEKDAPTIFTSELLTQNDRRSLQQARQRDKNNRKFPAVQIMFRV